MEMTFCQVEPRHQLEWMKHKHFKSKHRMVEASSDLGKSLVMLSRKIVWQDDGTAYNPDRRHCDRVLEALSLQHAKIFGHAHCQRGRERGRREHMSQGEEASLHADKRSLYRSEVARLSYWAVDCERVLS